jgi:hypothetical protein
LWKLLATGQGCGLAEEGGGCAKMQVLALKVQKLPFGIPPDFALAAVLRSFRKRKRPGTLPSGMEYRARF